MKLHLRHARTSHPVCFMSLSRTVAFVCKVGNVGAGRLPGREGGRDGRQQGGRTGGTERDPRHLLGRDPRLSSTSSLRDRPRGQSLEGFDDCYTDIVDYIVRCTHRIWDERDVGLIYTHYTHNCVLYTPLGTIHSRDEVIRDTIQRLVSFPERRGQATHVVWCGDDREGFYTSHLVTGCGRHTQAGHLGPPTGRPLRLAHDRGTASCCATESTASTS